MYQSNKTNLPRIAIRLMDCLDSIQCEYIFTQPLAVIFAPLQICEECKKYLLQIWYNLHVVVPVSGACLPGVFYGGSWKRSAKSCQIT